MNGFTSGKRAQLGLPLANHDPEPWEKDSWTMWPTADRRATIKMGERHYYSRNPRSEFDVLDNPILARFRAEEDGGRDAALGYLDLLQPEWGRDMGMLCYRWKAVGWSDDFGPAQIDHARRVLTKLAALA